jgi:hypothetical protein
VFIELRKFSFFRHKFIGCEGRELSRLSGVSAPPEAKLQQPFKLYYFQPVLLLLQDTLAGCRKKRNFNALTAIALKRFATANETYF